MAQVTFEGYPSPYAAAHPQGAHPQSGGYPPHPAHPAQQPAHPAYPHHAAQPASQPPYPAEDYGWSDPHSGPGYAPQPQRAAYTRAPGPSAAPGMSRLVNLAGAAVSVALLLGVGIWTYRLMVRDVTGVPVIQALDGLIRRSPDDPGGRQAPYQELSVNTVAAQGEAADAAQIIAVAPPPVELSAEDRAIAELNGAQSAPITAPSSPATLAPAPQPVAPTPLEQVASAQPAPPAPLTLVPASAPGVSRSPLPPRRPGAVSRVAAVSPAPQTGEVDAQAEAVLQDLVTRLSPADVMEIDAGSLAPGTRLVQLSVYESAAEARAAWDQLAARFPAYLDGRGRIVDSATAGGRTFFRLRAHGFVDEPEARRFCSVFLAQGVDCIPVLTGR